MGRIASPFPWKREERVGGRKRGAGPFRGRGQLSVVQIFSLVTYICTFNGANCENGLNCFKCIKSLLKKTLFLFLYLLYKILFILIFILIMLYGHYKKKLGTKKKILITKYLLWFVVGGGGGGGRDWRVSRAGWWFRRGNVTDLKRII